MQVNRNKYKDLLVIVVGFSLIGLLLLKGYEKPVGQYFIYGALILGVISIFSERVTTLVTQGWQNFGMLLGKINSTILLGVLFALLLSPMAILKRLTTKKEAEDQQSNWTETEGESVNFEKLW
ncbi:MAG: hypothetical protein GY751_25295 [Bacteroidetes bacterium]|nr:hypothetical protein [Bacteroidota bacterium]